MIPDGNSDHWEGMKSMGKSKCMGTYKRWGFLVLVSLKYIRLKFPSWVPMWFSMGYLLIGKKKM